MTRKVVFLAWESPWPAHSGAALRTLGLLKEISKVFKVELVVLTRQPLSNEQIAVLENHADRIRRVPLRDVSNRDKLRVMGLMLKSGFPYHSALLELSFHGHSDLLHYIRNFSGVVFTSVGHWGTLVCYQQSPNWVLNQCDADVEFWRVYASQAVNRIAQLAALINWKLSARHFPPIYSNVGRIISVCEEDRQLTLALASQAQIDVIENGVDCSYYVPERTTRTGPPRLLFTGTSVARNMTALRQFVCNVLPLIQRELPDVELLVGGNFGSKAQAEFSAYPNVRFTGRVDDMRPVFNQSDVFVAPFEETHGSKLKIAEAMAMAMPIVSTPQGIRGFSLVDTESVLVAENKEQFAAQAIALLRDPIRRERLGAAAREVALSTIDWPVLGKRLIEVVKSVQETNQ
jgi:glycosyltransferase involved in cell wall biosynthesis